MAGCVSRAGPWLEEGRGRRRAWLALVVAVATSCSGGEDPGWREASSAGDLLSSPWNASATQLASSRRATWIASAQRAAGPAYDFVTRGETAQALHRAQGLVASLTDGGIVVEPARRSALWSCTLRWTGLGRAHDSEDVSPAGAPSLAGNRASYRRADGSEEWYLLGPLGLEQGFVLQDRLRGVGLLVLELSLAGTLAARLSAAGDGVELVTATGQVALRYGDLFAFDADDRPLASALAAEGTTIRLQIDDAGARYPLRIDPLMWVEQSKLSPSDGGFERFGASVAIEVDTAVVGASGGTSNPNKVGQAYVLTRTGRDWSEQQKLAPSDGSVADSFADAVSLSGDTLVAGSRFHHHAGDVAGAAYAFVRSGTVWTEQQELLASDGAADDRFGAAVSVDLDTAVVGAPGELGDTKVGAAYVFARAAGAWTEQQKLLGSDQAASERFGTAVAVDGDTALVGAPDHEHGASKTGAVYLFVRTAGTWTEQQELLPFDSAANNHFGRTVALSGDTALVGASGMGGTGAAYVFVRSAGTWTEEQKLLASNGDLQDAFSWSLALDGDRALIGAIDAGGSAPSEYWGAAYLFARSGSTFTEEQILVPADPVEGDWFGYSVALSGTSAVLGAPSIEPSGGAYVFVIANTGEPCDSAGDCEAGWCVDGVCCDLPCGGNAPADCLACSVAAGAGVDGLCAQLSGMSCDDDLYCNGTETCADGVCAASTGDPCGGPDGDDDCAESCDEDQDDCLAPDPDGSNCPDGTCADGVCTPAGTGGNGTGGTSNGAGGHDGDDDGGDDGGCGCQLPPEPGTPRGWLLTLVAGLVMARVRRLHREQRFGAGVCGPELFAVTGPPRASAWGRRTWGGDVLEEHTSDEPGPGLSDEACFFVVEQVELSRRRRWVILDRLGDDLGA